MVYMQYSAYENNDIKLTKEYGILRIVVKRCQYRRCDNSSIVEASVEA